MAVLACRDQALEQQPELAPSRANSQKLIKLHSVLETLLRGILVHGFHGEATVKITVHDGTIQVIEECVERRHR
jgi:hypothetical protein